MYINFYVCMPTLPSDPLREEVGLNVQTLSPTPRDQTPVVPLIRYMTWCKYLDLSYQGFLIFRIVVNQMDLKYICIFFSNRVVSLV